MKNIEKLLDLQEFQVLKINTRYKNKVILDVQTKNEKQRCPHCNKYTNSINNKYNHQVRDNSIFGKLAYLNINRKVFICHLCNQVFTEQVESIYPKKIYTKRFEKTIFERCLENSIANVSRENKLPYDCVKGIYNRIADVCVEHLMRHNDDIEILGIDEISIRKGHGDFQAVVSNIGHGHVMDVLPDRKKETVINYLKKLPKKAKKRIIFVSMDMWDGYFYAAKEILPDTKIVIDRFHVMKNLNAAITKCRRDIQQALPKELKDKYKNYRWILVTNEENLTEKGIGQLKKMMKDCPELKELYNLKVDFQNIFDRTRKLEVAKEKLERWKKKVQELENEEMNKFIKLLENWGEWILNYFVSNKVTNGFVEGMNNKIKLLKRIGYGYRSKINFRKKVLVECGYNNLAKSKKLIFLS